MPNAQIDTSAHTDPAVYLTADVPGTGGAIKQRPEDFYVEELPLYELSGTGEHLYLFIEKRNMPTMQLISLLARHYGVAKAAVGYAGLKDKLAVTRQLLSIQLPGQAADGWPEFTHDRAKVLWTARHGNKLRQGHLAGNRFIIRVRRAEPAKVVHAHRTLSTLERTGVPNRAGEQRFGVNGNNHLIGRELLLGNHQAALDLLLGPAAPPPNSRSRLDLQAAAREHYAAGRYPEARAAFPRNSDTERRVLAALEYGRPARSALGVIPEMQRRYFISSLQSAVFNAVLAERLRAGTLDRLMLGDVAFKHDNGAAFIVDDAALADPETAGRLARLDISPSGPMWGAGMLRAQGAAAQAESRALAAIGLTEEDFDLYAATSRDRVPGARRALRVPLSFPDAEGGVDEFGPYIRCAFELPRGAFATVVMQEVMKGWTDAEGEGDDEQRDDAPDSAEV
ncbi:MAG: tRNA pseudouridine(13) synthase TruD [Phycisphaerales bacterium]|nr:tRNA pseudouridine(13) synthase TruD [Phycisphaerales bacterium]